MELMKITPWEGEYRFIPSPTVRAYIESTGHTFTDQEKASLIRRWPGPMEDSAAQLLRLSGETADEGLRARIAQWLDFARESIRTFYDTNGGRYVYRLGAEYDAHEAAQESIREGGESYSFFTDAVFASPDAARAWAETQLAKAPRRHTYKIEKYRLIASETDCPAVKAYDWDWHWGDPDRKEKPPKPCVQYLSNFPDHRVAVLCYDAMGKLFWFDTEELDDLLSHYMYLGAGGLNRYVFVPLPFADGDRVRFMDSDEVLIISEGIRTPEDWRKRHDEIVMRAKNAGIGLSLHDGWVRVTDEAGEHDHVDPLTLVYADAPTGDQRL